MTGVLEKRFLGRLTRIIPHGHIVATPNPSHSKHLCAHLSTLCSAHFTTRSFSITKAPRNHVTVTDCPSRVAHGPSFDLDTNEILPDVEKDDSRINISFMQTACRDPLWGCMLPFQFPPMSGAYWPIRIAFLNLLSLLR